MLGFIIGTASGIGQFWLLSRFSAAITRGKINNKVVILAISQFLLPIIVLVCCALLFPQNLLWIGAGMAASLIICAAVRFLFVLKK